MPTADDFEKALLLAGYAPSTARSARPAAVEDATGHAWSQRLFAQWKTDTLEVRRGAVPSLAIRLITAGFSAVDAHTHAKWYLACVAFGRPEEERTFAIRRVEKVLAEPDLFLGFDPEELSTRMKGLGLTVRQTADLLGVSRPAVRNWLAGKPIAPTWACDRLAAHAAENRPLEANKSEQDEE